MKKPEGAPPESGNQPLTRRDLLAATVGVLCGVALTGCQWSGDRRTTGREMPPAPEREQNGGWELDFSHMSDGPINPDHFNYDVGTEIPGYNDEQQVYTNRPENVRIESGRLVIEAHNETFTHNGNTRQYTSGRITTKGKLGITCGAITVRAKIPRGVGTWPAIWMLSTNTPYTTAKGWETENPDLYYLMNGEIDIFEGYGYLDGMAEAGAHTYETGANPSLNGAGMAHETRLSGMYDTFHDYGLVWEPEKLTFTIDGLPVHAVHKKGSDPKSWPFTAENTMHLVLNLAVGGGKAEQQVVDARSFPARMDIEKISYKPLAPK